MRFRTGAPTLLIVAALFTISALSVASNWLSQRMSASIEEGRFELMGRILDATLQRAEAQAIASAEMIAAMPEVQRAFAARDRDALLAATRAAYAVQSEKYGISQAQFHLAPAQSFLRVHNPAKYGEDLSSYRQLVVEVNRLQALRKGVEITTSGVGIFGTLPMHDAEGQASGSFEMALEFGPLLDEIKKDYGFEASLLMDAAQLRDTATSLKGEALSEHNRVGEFARFYATHPELLRALVRDRDTVVGEQAHYLRDVAGVPYGVLVKPLYNYAKKRVGLIVLAQSFADTRSAEGQAIVWQTLLGLVAVVVLAGAALIVIRGGLLRPLDALNRAFADLAAGRGEAELPDAQGQCRELQELAAHAREIQAHLRERGRGTP